MITMVEGTASWRSGVAMMTDILVAIGETDNGYLWRYLGEVDEVPEPTPNPFWLAALAIVFGIVAITALPTGRRLRPMAERTGDDSPADTFEEDDSA